MEKHNHSKSPAHRPRKPPPFNSTSRCKLLQASGDRGSREARTCIPGAGGTCGSAERFRRLWGLWGHFRAVASFQGSRVFFSDLAACLRIHRTYSPSFTTPAPPQSPHQAEKIAELRSSEREALEESQEPCGPWLGIFRGMRAWAWAWAFRSSFFP